MPFVKTSVKFINYSILLYIHNTEIYKTKRRDANKWTICISTKRIRLFFHIYLVHIVPTVLKTHLPVFDSMYGSYFLSSRLNVHNKSFTYIQKFIDLPTIILLFMIFQFYYESHKKHFYKPKQVLSLVRFILVRVKYILYLK